MKKNKLLYVIMAGLLCVSLLSACGPAGQENIDLEQPEEMTEDIENTEPAGEEAIAENDGEFFVGLSLPTQQEERWVKDGENINAELASRGIKVATQQANNDANRQISQCENLISQGVDLLIVAPVDSQGASVIAEMAKEAGVIIMSYGRLILNAEVDYYVSSDIVETGRLQGKYITELAPKGNYVLLYGDPADNLSNDFKVGMFEYLQPLIDSGDITIVADQAVRGWDPANALKIMEDALTANDNDIQAVICPNDATAGACIEALAVQGLAGEIPISGGDCDLAAVKRIIEGTQSMTVFYDIKNVARVAAEAVEAISKGETPETFSTTDNGKVEVPTVKAAPEAIDKNNYESRLVDSGEISAEDLS